MNFEDKSQKLKKNKYFNVIAANKIFMKIKTSNVTP